MMLRQEAESSESQAKTSDWQLKKSGTIRKTDPSEIHAVDVKASSAIPVVKWEAFKTRLYLISRKNRTGRVCLSLLVERVEFVYMDASNLACATWGDGPFPLKRPSILSHPWRTRSATSFSLLPDSVLGICGQDVKFRGTHALHFPYP